MAAQRCATSGCGRFVGRDAVWCARHHPGSGPAEIAAEMSEREAEFQRRLASGEYRHLFGEVLRGIIEQAANEPGLADEIGVLRVVLAKLLVEERDPAQLAESVSRVAGVAVQAARAQRAITGEQADGLTEAITQILVELDGAAV